LPTAAGLIPVIGANIVAEQLHVVRIVSALTP
jgi:hypothetical protein